jgi:hypothetical protein
MDDRLEYPTPVWGETGPPRTVSVDSIIYTLSSPALARHFGFSETLRFAQATWIEQPPEPADVIIHDSIEVDAETYPILLLSCWALPWRLQAVHVPASVEILDEWAFSACPYLQIVTFAPTINLHRLCGFRYCSIAQLQVPPSVVSIEPACFCHCISLRSIEFVGESQLQSIKGSFHACPLLAALILPRRLAVIKDSIIDCPSLDTISFEAGDGPLKIKNSIRDCQILSALDLPASAARLIGSVHRCPILSQLNFRTTQLSGIYGCIHECQSLASITFPVGLAALDGSVCGCRSLLEIRFERPSALEEIDGSIHDCPRLRELSFDASTRLCTIRHSVLRCTGLASLQLAPFLESLSNSIVQCPSLHDLTFHPESRISVIENSIQDCGTISLLLPGSLARLSYSIVRCRSLWHLTFHPESHISLIENSIQECGTASLSLPSSLGKITGSVVCSRFLGTLVFPLDSRLSSIESSFIDCPVLQAVAFPSALCRITDSFSECRSLTQTTFSPPSHLRELSGFSRTALAIVDLPESLEVVRGFEGGSQHLHFSFGRDCARCSVRVDHPFCVLAYPSRLVKLQRSELEWSDPYRSRPRRRSPSAHAALRPALPSPVFHASQALGEEEDESSHHDSDSPQIDEEVREEEFAEDHEQLLQDGDEVPERDEGFPDDHQQVLEDDEEVCLNPDDAAQDGDEVFVADEYFDEGPADTPEPDTPSPDSDGDAIANEWFGSDRIDVDDDDELASQASAVLAQNERQQRLFVIKLASSLCDAAREDLKMTPRSLVDAISLLEGEGEAFIQGAGFRTLAHYVREVTRLDDRSCSPPLFSARDTGTDRCTQVFRCHLHVEGCPAGFKIKMYRSGMQLGDHEFHHSHEVGDPGERRAYHNLTPEAIAQIIEMTQHHATPGMIRDALDLNATAGVFYAARRRTLMEQRKDQVKALSDAVRSWRGWVPFFVPPNAAGEFQGFFAVQTQIVEHPMCRDTLGMDDTSCTNFFELVAPAIIAPDANSKTQLVAFAILRDQTSDALVEFLTWVLGYLRNEQPKAFIIDRAAAEILAIGQVFTESYICFCLMHVFRNLEEKCGKNHVLVKEFWGAMRGDVHKQHEYRILLYTTFEKNRSRPDKKKLVNCVARVCNDWVHIAPYITSRYTCMDQTARNEGFNGRIKVYLDHRRMELAYVANAYRLMGEVAFRTSQHMKTQFIPCGILSLKDQHFVGRLALELLLDQMLLFKEHRRAPAVRDLPYTGNCCTCHNRYPGFPCCHLLRDRYKSQKAQNHRLCLRYFLEEGFAGTPLLTLGDIPPRWHRLLTARAPALEKPPPFVRPPRAPLDGPAARDYLELVRDAEQSPALLREINRFRARTEHLLPGRRPADPIPDRLDEGEDNPAESTGALPDAGYVGVPRDPPLRDDPGAPRQFPSHFSPLWVQRGGR